MSGHPPPPPPRKPPPAAKPPQAAPPGAHPPEPAESSSSASTIIWIIVIVLVVVIVLPSLACGGGCLYLRYQAQQFADQLAREMEQELQEQQQRELAREQAMLRRIEKPLHDLVKIDLWLHWPKPDGLRRIQWLDWAASKVSDTRYAISGTLNLGIKDEGTRSHKWKCEYSTFDEPTDANANWTLETIQIDGQQVYP